MTTTERRPARRAAPSPVRPGVLRPALRRRWVEAALTLGLSALICATGVLVPVLEREIVQSVLNVRRAQAPVTDLGLRHVATATQPGQPVPPTESLNAQLPQAARVILSTPVSEVTGTFAVLPGRAASPVGRLRARTNACAHVTIRSGRCPTTAGQVLVAAVDAERRGWRVGTRVPVDARTGGSAPVTLTVTGTYTVVDGPYWFGDRGDSRLAFDGDAVEDPSRVLVDLLTPEATLTAFRPTPDVLPRVPAEWPGISREVDYPPTSRELETDAFLRGAKALAAFVIDRTNVAETGWRVQRASSAGPYAATIEGERDQVRTTVPLLLGQFALVVASVLWLVLVALTSARRPEMAISRLRGRSIGRVRRLLLAESSGPILVGALCGGLVAAAAAVLASRVVLPGAPRLLVRPGDLWWLAAAVVLCLALAVVAVLRPSRRPVVELLRDVPVRVAGSGLGPLPAVVVALGLVLLVGALTGTVTGAAVGLAPALLAAAAGVVVSRLAPAVLTAAGRAALRRGRAVTATARLEAARRPTGRWLVPVTAVASASLVFGLTSWGLAADSYDELARARVGAPVALRVDAPDLLRLSTTVAGLDPGLSRATPVVVLRRAVATTVAVDPVGFARVADLAGEDQGIDLSVIGVPSSTSIRVAGRFLSGTARAAAVTPAAATGTLRVSLDVEARDGSRRGLDVVDVPLSGAATSFSVYTPCFEECTVRAVRVDAAEPRDGLGARLSLTGLRMDDRPVALGASDQWTPFSQEPAHLRVDARPDALVLDAATAGRRQLVAASTAQPSEVPGILTPGLLSAVKDGVLRTSDAGGSGDLFVVPRGRIGRVPIVGAGAVVVSIDGLLTTGRSLDPNGSSYVLLADDDPSFVASARKALADAGIPVLTERRPGQVVDELRTSAAAWSLRLAILTAALSLLTAVLGLVVLAENSRRSRTWDLAALRLMGVAPRDIRRTALGELVPLSALGVLAGIGCGVLGGVVAIRTLPMYPVPPEFDVVTSSPSLASIAVAGLVALVPVVVAAAWSALRAARTATLQRLREAG